MAIYIAFTIIVLLLLIPQAKKYIDNSNELNNYKKMTFSGQNDPLPREHPNKSYVKKTYFFSNAERDFFEILKQILPPNDYHIFAKVRLVDLLLLTSKSYSDFNKVKAKHIDFVICDSKLYKPLLAIELDDKSHRKPDRMKRDYFVDKIFEFINLPILHIPAKHSYNTNEISNSIFHIISSDKVINPVQHSSAQTSPESIVISDPDSSILNQAIPICGKCGIPMVKRISSRGERKGKEFYGCANYPKCKETVQIE